MFYDAKCRLCGLFRDIVLRLDFRGCIFALPLNARGVKPTQVSDERRWMSSFHILDERGVLVSGGDALVVLLQILLPFVELGKFMERSTLTRKMVRASYRKIAVLKSRLECGLSIRGGS